MGRAPWAVYAWPGLPQMWRQGAWSGLLVAAVFAVLVNLLLLGTFLWSEVLRSNLRWVGWLTLAACWGLAALWSRIEESRAADRDLRCLASDALPRAMDAYLKGQWFEAECTLAEILDRRPQDIEARLLQATLYRHTRRYAEARTTLDYLERLQGAGKWVVEIVRERELLDTLEAEAGAALGESLVSQTAHDPHASEVSHATPIAAVERAA